MFTMKFAFNFYISTIFLIQKIWRIQGSADFNAAELERLSQKLHPTECMKLLESIYLRTPAYVVKDEKNENSRIELTQEDCHLKLEQWNRMFPGNNKQARAYVVKSLIHIGRTDLANFIKTNERFIRILNNFIKPGDLYLYNKYLPRRYSKRLLSQLNPERESIDDDNPKEYQFNKNQIMENNSNSKSSIDKHPIKKEITYAKNISSKEQSRSQNKFQTRAAAASEDSKKSSSDEVSVAYWMIIFFGVMLGVLVVLTILTLAFHYKTGKKILNAFLSKGRCDPRCGGYESFPRDSESEWVTDVTPRRWRRSSSIPSLTLSTVSIPEKKPLKTRPKKTKKSVDEKKKLKKDMQKRTQTEKEKKQKEKMAIRKKKECYAEERMMSKEMQKSIADDVARILRKDRTECSCSNYSVSRDRPCRNDTCGFRKIRNSESPYFIRPQTCSITQRLSTMRKMDAKAKLREEKEQRRRLSSAEVLTKEGRDSQLTTPRTCIRESIFGNPKKKESSPKEKSPIREKPLPKEKSFKRLIMEPCTNETCSIKALSRASTESNQVTRRSKFF